MKFETFLSTNGSGFWSNRSAVVKITGIEISYVNEERDFGELRVHFDPKSWDVKKDGLIYTDKNFLSGLRHVLNEAGLAGHDVEYSEQGMQGHDYVSLDAGEEFIKSFSAEMVDH